MAQTGTCTDILLENGTQGITGFSSYYLITSPCFIVGVLVLCILASSKGGILYIATPNTFPLLPLLKCFCKNQINNLFSRLKACLKIYRLEIFFSLLLVNHYAAV